jgi:hypothetical protein
MKFDLMIISRGIPLGVIFSHGPYWKELRRFLLRNLRDFGFGKSTMEDLFIEEVSKLCHKLSKNDGQPVDLSGSMNVSIINSLWTIVVGEKLDLEDPNLLKVADLIDQFLHRASSVSPLVHILPHPCLVI